MTAPNSWISSSPLLSFRPTEQNFPFLNISRLLVGLHSPRRHWYGFWYTHTHIWFYSLMFYLASGKTYLHHCGAACTHFVKTSSNCTRRKSREEPRSACQCGIPSVPKVQGCELRTLQNGWQGCAVGKVFDIPQMCSKVGVQSTGGSHHTRDRIGEVSHRRQIKNFHAKFVHQISELLSHIISQPCHNIK